MERLLLHICCGPDLTYAYEYFSKKYDVMCCFANDNIDTEEEFEKRFIQSSIVSAHYGFNLIKADYDPERFLTGVKGFENEEEQGERCFICHRLNFEKIADEALKANIKNISTTLTVSPHKNVEKINETGRDVADKYGLHFIEETLRKNNGFKRSVDVSKKLSLYRQNYCGCTFSRGNSG